MDYKQRLISDYKDEKKRLDTLWRAERKMVDKIEKEQMERAIGLLKSIGAKDVSSNGYVYNFTVGNRRFSLCNQTTRIVGESLLTDHRDLYELIHEHGDNFKEDRKKAKAIAEFQHYCVNGEFEDTLLKIAKGKIKGDDGEYY